MTLIVAKTGVIHFKNKRKTCDTPNLKKNKKNEVSKNKKLMEI